MPEAAIFLTFMLAVLLVELTPGPNMAWLAVLSATEGRRAGLSATAGIALGLLMIGAASALGLATLIDQFSVLYEILRWGGALFLMYLAWEGWRDAGESSPASTDRRPHRHFIRGFVINALNPKAGLFFVAALPQFMNANESVTLQAAILTITYIVIATIVHLALVGLAGSAQALLDNAVVNQRVRRILSALLVGVAIWLFISTAR
jgi:threonine/homoserine/homoserine lactone efflux protein